MTNEITPERLKLLAERLGEETKIMNDGCWVLDNNIYEQYIPNEDWEQCGELLEKLLEEGSKEILLYKLTKSSTNCRIVSPTKEVYVEHSLTTQEAIVLAAFEYYGI